jgi:hypothetical protein
LALGRRSAIAVCYSRSLWSAAGRRWMSRPRPGAWRVAFRRVGARWLRDMRDAMRAWRCESGGGIGTRPHPRDRVPRMRPRRPAEREYRRPADQDRCRWSVPVRWALAWCHAISATVVRSVKVFFLRVFVWFRELDSGKRTEPLRGGWNCKSRPRAGAGRRQKLKDNPMRPVVTGQVEQATRCGAKTRSSAPCKSAPVTGRQR